DPLRLRTGYNKAADQHIRTGLYPETGRDVSQHSSSRARSRGRARIGGTQVVTDYIEINALWRSSRDIGELALTTESILHIRIWLWAGRTYPISEIAVRILAESD